MRPLNRDKPFEKTRTAVESPPSPSGALLPSSPAYGRFGWEPLAVANDFERYFDNLRRNMETMLLPAWSNIGLRPSAAGLETEFARADFCDEGEAFEVHVELPGFSRDEVNVELTPERISIEARKELDESEATSARNYFARERGYTSLRRTFEFPEPVLAEKAEAELKDGLLVVRAPKEEPTEARKSVHLKVK